MLYIYCVLSCFFGIILGIILSLQYFKYKSSPKVQKEPEIQEKHTFEKDSQLYNISLLLEEVKNNKKLPIHISQDVLKSMIIIANTDNWHTQLDKLTLDNLETFFHRWQNHINKSKKPQVIDVESSYGFDKKELWEGTAEEYEKALQDGKITDNMDVHIIEYTGEYLSMNNDGEYKEEMN